MKLKRFYYVRAPKGTVVHRNYSKTHSEGITACGLPVFKGWLWWVGVRPRIARCKNCERAA